MDKTTKILTGEPNLPIQSRDFCSFIKLRKNRLVDMKECWYCQYAEFAKDNGGICKFNNEEKIKNDL